VSRVIFFSSTVATLEPVIILPQAMQNNFGFAPWSGWTDLQWRIFAVVIPVILLLWAFVQKRKSDSTLINYLLAVSSLLAITIYLLIAALPVGFISGLMAYPHSISGSGWISTKKLRISKRLETHFQLVALGDYCLLSVGCDRSATSVASHKNLKQIFHCLRAWLEPPLLFKEPMPILPLGF